jgi:hypothetical protein
MPFSTIWTQYEKHCTRNRGSSPSLLEPLGNNRLRTVSFQSRTRRELVDKVFEENRPPTPTAEGTTANHSHPIPPEFIMMLRSTRATSAVAAPLSGARPRGSLSLPTDFHSEPSGFHCGCNCLIPPVSTSLL